MKLSAILYAAAGLVTSMPVVGALLEPNWHPKSEAMLVTLIATSTALFGVLVCGLLRAQLRAMRRAVVIGFGAVLFALSLWGFLCHQQVKDDVVVYKENYRIGTGEGTEDSRHIFIPSPPSQELVDHASEAGFPFWKAWVVDRNTTTVDAWLQRESLSDEKAAYILTFTWPVLTLTLCFAGLGFAFRDDTSVFE